MSNLSILFSIVTLVYNNGINLKIQGSHQRHLTTTFKIAPCMVLLVNVFKQKKGGKHQDFNGLIKCQTAPLLSLQNGQVFKSNRTYTLREFPERFAKDRMRLHELSPLSKGQSICVFRKNQIKIKITKQGKNVMNIV